VGYLPLLFGVDDMKIPKQNVQGDWRFLIVLDACRFDSFKAVSKRLHLEGDLEKVWSEAGHTISWYEHYWPKHYPDICLLTAHPASFKTEYGFNNHFAASIPLWKKGVVDSHLDAQATITRAVNIVKDDHWPRYLIHLIPPHLPFIGLRGKAFLRDLGFPRLRGSVIYEALDRYGREGGWLELHGYYEESLEAVLRMLKHHQSIFRGTTILTSDHGEVIGEHGCYYHGAEGSKYPVTAELHEVPWFHWHTS